MKKLLNAFMAASLLGGATSLLSINYAYAQAGTGELRGQIKDSKTGEGIVGATVVATSPVLQGEQKTSAPPVVSSDETIEDDGEVIKLSPFEEKSDFKEYFDKFGAPKIQSNIAWRVLRKK